MPTLCFLLQTTVVSIGGRPLSHVAPDFLSLRVHVVEMEAKGKMKKEARRSRVGNQEKGGSSAVCYYGKEEDSGMVETAACLNSLRTLHE